MLRHLLRYLCQVMYHLRWVMLTVSEIHNVMYRLRCVTLPGTLCITYAALCYLVRVIYHLRCVTLPGSTLTVSGIRNALELGYVI